MPVLAPSVDQARPGPWRAMAMLEVQAAHPAEMQRDARQIAARGNYHDFLRYCWRLRAPFIDGAHIRALCDRLTLAVAELREGLSTFLLVQWPIRHSKSETSTIHFVPWFLGNMRLHDLDPDVIVTGYGADLAETFSRRAQGVIRSDSYREVFPGVELDKEATGKWTLKGSQAGVLATGLGGALPGHGAALAILDDFCKSRLEAESQVVRDTTWSFVTEGLMTRLAPASIVLIPATPWHIDDVAGRIEKAVEEDPDFPRFEVMRFPARGPYGDREFLWEERMGRAWYLRQYAGLGQYSAAALLDCNPKQKGMQTFDEDWFLYYVQGGEMAPGKDCKWFIIVDYAGGETDEHCEAVILEYAWGPGNTLYFDRLTRGRMGASLLKQKILEAVQRRQATTGLAGLGLETSAALVLKAWVQESMRESGIRCNIYRVESPPGSGSPKAGEAKLRIEALVDPYATGRIRHNAGMGSEVYWNGRTKEWVDRTFRKGELERQLLAYPSIPDDCMDAAAYALKKLGVAHEARPKRKPWAAMTLEEQDRAHTESLLRRQKRGAMAR